MWNVSSENTREKIISADIFSRYFSSTKNRNIKNRNLPSIARLNKAKLTEVNNQVRISYRNDFPLSFSSLVVELDEG